MTILFPQLLKEMDIFDMIFHKTTLTLLLYKYYIVYNNLNTFFAFFFFFYNFNIYCYVGTLKSGNKISLHICSDFTS